MNFLGKKVCITGDFSNFKREEMEFLMAQLGAVISNHKKADIILTGDAPGADKIEFARDNSIPIIEMKELEKKVSEDEDKILSNPEILKEIQKQLVDNTPKYLGREVMNEHTKELIEKKLQDPKVSKTWIKQFYENIFINSLPKEKMVMEIGSIKAKEHGLDWILKNESIESFTKNRMNKTRETLVFQNDDSLDEDSILKGIFKNFPESLYLSKILPNNYSKLLGNKIILSKNKNFDIYKLLLEIYGTYFLKYADESLRKDREVVLEAVKSDGYALEYVDKSFKKDREIVLELVKSNGSALEYTDESLRRDREIVLEAVKSNGWVLLYADKSFRKDREIVLEAVKSRGSALAHADKSFGKDREIVLEAVKSDGWVLKCADKSFGKDREIVLEAVKSRGSALEYADESLRRDREIVLEAVKSDGTVLKYANESLRKDREIVLAAVKGWGLQYTDICKLYNRDRVSQMIEWVLEYADESFKKDREIALEAVKSNGNALEYLDESFKKDRGIVMEAVKQNGSALEYADKKIREYFVWDLIKDAEKNENEGK